MNIFIGYGEDECLLEKFEREEVVKTISEMTMSNPKDVANAFKILAKRIEETKDNVDDIPEQYGCHVCAHAIRRKYVNGSLGFEYNMLWSCAAQPDRSLFVKGNAYMSKKDGECPYFEIINRGL
jgi:hypothetical protein